MGRFLSDEGAVQRPHLVTAEQVRYIESRQRGFSDKDLAKLNELEWFVLNRNSGYLLSCSIPGLRAQPGVEVQYVKRFNSDTYLKMINEFLDHVPPDFPRDQTGRCNLPSFRLTSKSAQFYPIEFNGDLVAWRKRLNDNARAFNTLIGRFEEGRFLLSNGARIGIILWQFEVPPCLELFNLGSTRRRVAIEP